MQRPLHSYLITSTGYLGAGVAVGATTKYPQAAVYNVVVPGPQTITLRDGGPAGPVKLALTGPAAGSLVFSLSGGYIDFATDCHVTISGAGPAFIFAG